MTPETDWQARRDAEAGMAQALAGANNANSDWGDAAYSSLECYCKNMTGVSFTAPMFTAWAFKWDELPVPPTDKAFGSIFTKAARNGLIRKVGYRPHPLRHASPTVLWEVV